MAGWDLVANAGAGQPVTVSGTLPFLIQDVDGAELFGLFMLLRIAHALAQYVTGSFVEQGVNQRGRKATEASTSAWADLWRDVWCEIDAWEGLGDTLSVRKVKAHTAPEAMLAGVITADHLAGNDLAGAACKLVPRRTSGLRGLPVTRMAHWIVRVGCARQRLGLARPGSLGVDERQRDGPRERDLGCQRSQPSSEEGTCLSRAPQGAFARSASTQHAVGAVVPQAPEHVAQRCNSGLTALRDLLQRGKVVSVLCSVCGSYGGRLVRRSLLTWCSDSWEAAGAARRVVGFRAWLQAHCTSRQYSWGKFGVPSVVQVAPGAHFLRVCPAPFLSQQRCSMF